MTEDQFTKLISDNTEMKAGIRHIVDQLKIVDKRLSLIEQRRENIEPWVSVDNRKLVFTGQVETVTA